MLQEQMLNALLFLKSTINHFGGISNIHITADLRISCRNAHARYAEAARQRKLQQDNETVKRAQREMEKSMSLAIEKDHQVKQFSDQQACASHAVANEKKKIDQKDKLISELISARNMDKVRYDNERKRTFGHFG